MQSTWMMMGTLAGLSLACGGGGGEEAAAPAPAARAASPAPDPLAGRSLVEICGDSALALIRFDFDTLQADFAGTCCGPGKLPPGEGPCVLDFPFSDVPECSAYSYMRNDIYARYGYPFEKPQWQETFGGMPWYQRRDDFQEGWLSETARKNVAKLQQLEADKVGCAP